MMIWVRKCCILYKVINLINKEVLILIYLVFIVSMQEMEEQEKSVGENMK